MRFLHDKAHGHTSSKNFIDVDILHNFDNYYYDLYLIKGVQYLQMIKLLIYLKDK